jgi:hypothetical protein
MARRAPPSVFTSSSHMVARGSSGRSIHSSVAPSTLHTQASRAMRASGVTSVRPYAPSAMVAITAARTPSRMACTSVSKPTPPLTMVR